MTKRTFRPKPAPSGPRYPSRTLLALGAAAALSACGPTVVDGDPVMPEVDAGIDAGFETAGVAPMPDAGEPDAGEPDAGMPEETAGVPAEPDAGE